MQADLFGGSIGRTDAPEILDAREADYTPIAVALQLLLALEQVLADLGVVWTPHHALDPSAGSGCWGRAMRAVWPDLSIIGVEPRDKEADNLLAAYDAGCVGEILDVNLGRMFDLIASNPPFSVAFGTEGRPFWPVEFARRHMLTSSGIVLFLGLTQWGQGEEAAGHLAAWPPFLQIRCGGRPQFRGAGTVRLAPIPKERRIPGGPTHEERKNTSDSREYCAWGWRRQDLRRQDIGRPVRRVSWHTVQLPVLPAELRVWQPSAVPGTYPIDSALVAEVRRYL